MNMEKLKEVSLGFLAAVMLLGGVFAYTGTIAHAANNKVDIDAHTTAGLFGMINVPAALVTTNSTTSVAIGQVHNGAGFIFRSSRTNNRYQVTFSSGGTAHNGWAGRTLWIGRGTFRECGRIC